MRRAAFWVAWGDGYIEEAKISASSVERHMPDIDRVLYTREENVGRTAFSSFLKPSFEKRLKHAHPMLRGLRRRVDAIHQLSDYDQLLFLDVDTYICAPVYDMFDALDRFDIMFTSSTGLRRRKEGPALPDIFPEYNSGVVPFRNNDRVRAFHDAWYELYKEHRYAFQNSNQRSLREAIWADKSGLQVYVMPTEYNCRFQLGVWVKLQVKILHGRAKDITKVEGMMNRRAGRMRAWRPWEIS